MQGKSERKDAYESNREERKNVGECNKEREWERERESVSFKKGVKKRKRISEVRESTNVGRKVRENMDKGEIEKKSKNVEREMGVREEVKSSSSSE